MVGGLEGGGLEIVRGRRLADYSLGCFSVFFLCRFSGCLLEAFFMFFMFFIFCAMSLLGSQRVVFFFVFGKNAVFCEKVGP